MTNQSSLVMELQRDALDDKVPVSSLLRKALVAASKLGVTDAESWIRAELNGYVAEGGDAESFPVPPYRILTGQLRAQNPIRGWVPVVGELQGKMVQLTKRLPMRQAIVEVEQLAKSSRELHIPVSAAEGMPINLFIQPTDLLGIADRVRGIVLSWALDLEKKGIRGEGLTFGDQERETARSVSIVNYISPVAGSLVQHFGTGDVVATMTTISERRDEIIEIVRRVREQMGELTLDAESRAKLEEALTTVERETTAQEPSKGKLLAGMKTTLDVLGAAGGATALIEPITHVLKALLGV